MQEQLQTNIASSKTKKIIRNLIFLILSVVLLYFSFRGVKWNDFITGLKSCNYYWILASMFVGFLGFVVRALRWRLLLLPLNNTITRKETYNGVTIAYLTNFAFPRAGEIARCGVVAKSSKVSFEGALGTVVLERSFDLFCLILWVVLLLVFKWSEFGSFLQDTLFKPFVDKLSGNLLLSLGIVFGVLALIIAVFLAVRNKLKKSKIYKKIAEIVKGLIKGFFSAFRMKNKWLFLSYTLLLWGTYWLTSITTIYAFPSVSGLNVIDALFLMIVGGLGWTVPVQGGLGAYHLIISLALLAVYGIAQTTGVVFATISHESQALVMIICGTASIINMSLNKKNSKP